MAKYARVVDDLTDETSLLVHNEAPVRWGANSLDTDREAFTEEEIAIADLIGTPLQGTGRLGRKSDDPTTEGS